MAEHRDQKPAPDIAGEDTPSGVAKMRASLSARVGAIRNSIAARLPNWSRRTQIAIGVGLVLVVVHAAALSIWLPKIQKSEAQRHATLPAALAALDQGKFIEARQLATALADSPLLDPSQRGGPSFILGAVAMADADLKNEPDRSALYQQAAKYLQDSRVRGFPESANRKVGFYWARPFASRAITRRAEFRSRKQLPRIQRSVKKHTRCLRVHSFMSQIRTQQKLASTSTDIWPAARFQPNSATQH